MKRTLFFAVCLSLMLCTVGCGNGNIPTPTLTDEISLQTEPPETESATEAETQFNYITSNEFYKIFPVKITSNRIDTSKIEYYLRLSESYPNFFQILNNVPDIFSYFVNVTPHEMSRKCVIYRCTYNGTSLGGQTFLVYGDSVFNLCGDNYGYGGGYGVTELAYRETEDKLYFIYSYGSGVLYTNIGVLDFKTRTLSDYALSYDSTLELPNFFNASFCLSDDKDTLGLCLADYKWISSNSFEIDIKKGECFLEDVSTLDFREINPMY